MRTNIVIDDALVTEAMALTGIRTKRALVDQALRELIKTHKKKDLLDLAGKLTFAEDYDHKAARELRDGAD